MKQRYVFLVVALTMVWGWGNPRLQAQGTAPQIYSYTLMGGDMVVKVSRDGSREVVDQIMLAGNGRDKEYRGHILYDFRAHKIYTKVVSDPSVPCSVMDYTSPEATPLFDPISSATELNQQMAGDHPPGKLGSPQTVNGIAAKIVEATSDEGKTKMWIAEHGGYLFPVKVVLIGADGKEQTFIEMKEFTFAKPPVTAFAPPTGCATIQGEASATGGHAEFGAGESSSKPTTNVTAVTLQKIPSYNGPCPAHIKMVGTITADGPGKVYYQFGAGTFEAGETITFSAAGTETDDLSARVWQWNGRFSPSGSYQRRR